MFVVFKERGKPEYPEKNLPEQSREPDYFDNVMSKFIVNNRTDV